MRNDLRYDIDLHQVKRQERNVCLGSLADIVQRHVISALPPIADIRQCGWHVRKVP